MLARIPRPEELGVHGGSEEGCRHASVRKRIISQEIRRTTVEHICSDCGEILGRQTRDQLRDTQTWIESPGCPAPFRDETVGEDPTAQNSPSVAIEDRQPETVSERPVRQFLEVGAALGWPELSIGRGQTLLAGQQGWERFAETANGYLVPALERAAALLGEQP